MEGEQKAVQGLMEYIGNGDGTLLVIYEENKLNGMEGNSRIDGDVVCGPSLNSIITRQKNLL